MCPEEQKDNPTLDEEKINCKPLTLNSTRHRSAFLVNVFWFSDWVRDSVENAKGLQWGFIVERPTSASC